MQRGSGFENSDYCGKKGLVVVVLFSEVRVMPY